MRTIRPISYYEGLDMVAKAGRTWVEILVLVLYTGPMLVLYNDIIRGVGPCGEVAACVEFWSEEFECQLKSQTVEARMKKAGHKFSSTIHCVASAVKRLQSLVSRVQGVKVYRGLGGLGISDFLAWSTTCTWAR